MNVAYIVIAHKLPRQLARLIEALQGDETHFFVHIDRKTGIDPFVEHLRARTAKHVHFVAERVSVTWGGFSLVRAIVRSLQAVEASGLAFHHLFLMSGQCYPIKSPDRINSFLRQHAGREIISVLSLEDEWRQARHRITKYHLDDYGNGAIRRLLRLANRYLPARRFIHGMRPFGGSAYFAVTQECTEYLLRRVRSDATYRRFFELTANPDELFFHTLIMNSDFADSVHNWNPWYVDWPEDGAPHPRLLRTEDFGELKASEKLFARKFDIEQDAEILDLIDAELL